MKFDFKRFEYLWAKKKLTKKEDNELKRMCIMLEIQSGLEDPDSLRSEDV